MCTICFFFLYQSWLMCSLILNKPWAYNPICSAVMAPLLHFFSFSSHPVFTRFPSRYDIFAGSISVCTLSSGSGWLGELPLHTFITWTIFICAGCFFRAADERDLERRTRCVGSACRLSVCFSFDLDMIQVCLLSSFSSFFPLFDMLVGLYFYSISPLLSLISYFYQYLSFSSLWLWVFLLLFPKLHFHKYHIFLMLQFLLISRSTFQPVFIFTLPLLPCIIFSAYSYLFLSSHLQLRAVSLLQLCFSPLSPVFVFLPPHFPPSSMKEL